MKVIFYLKFNKVPVIMRRIRPAYMKNDKAAYNSKGQLVDGEIARPFYNDIVTLKIKNDSPDYSGGEDYYNQEELNFLRTNNV